MITLSGTTSRSIINAMKSVFSRHGIPGVIFSDNGPQFSAAEFAEFAQTWEFQHLTSSPHFPQSNGLSESAVKTVKSLNTKALHSNQDIHKALLAYRSTAVIDGLSPAELLMGRRIRTTLPVHQSLLTKPWMKKVANTKQQIQGQQKAYYDADAKDLVSLKRGQSVRIQDSQTGRWDKEGVVTGKLDRRSYEVQGICGRVYRRNRRVLRSVPTSLSGPKPSPQPKPKPLPIASGSDSVHVRPELVQTVQPRRSSRIRQPPVRWKPESY